MYGLTRGTLTLIGVGVAGFLIWLATQIGDDSTGGYWAVYGLLAAAGLTMALSQLLGGWTKWGLPRVSGSVFLIAFLPALVAGGWLLLAHQPELNWFRTHVLGWSGDLGVRGFVNDMREYVPVVAFGLGLVFGLTFDTTGPRRPREVETRETAVVKPRPGARTPDSEPEPATVERRPTVSRTEVERDDVTVQQEPIERPEPPAQEAPLAERGTPAAPQPTPPPRDDEK